MGLFTNRATLLAGVCSRRYQCRRKVSQWHAGALPQCWGYLGTFFQCLGNLRQGGRGRRRPATSEAHDSGLCAVRAAFASNLLNLTLASPAVNRHQKSAKDVAEWTPDLNKCWFVARTLEVRRKDGLTIDRDEAEPVEAVLSQCDSTEMVVVECGTGAVPVTRPGSTSASHDDDVDGPIVVSHASPGDKNGAISARSRPNSPPASASRRSFRPTNRHFEADGQGAPAGFPNRSATTGDRGRQTGLGRSRTRRVRLCANTADCT